MIIHLLILGIVAFCQGHERNYEGYCPDGFHTIGYICYKYIYEKTNLSRALESCEHQRNYDDIQQKFKENVCNLLTIGKIMEFRREEVNRHQTTRIFEIPHMEIIINSFKYDGKWYQLNQVPREINSKYLFKDIIHDYEMTQEILAQDFVALGFSNVTYEMGEDFSILVYDLHSDTLRAVKHFHEFPYICTHKRTDKPGETCPGQTHECNDRGICFNGECYCYEGYDSDRCIPYAVDHGENTTTTIANGETTTTITTTTTTTTTTTLPPPCSCTDVTVYSICNSDNSEIGTYNSIGQDSDGYSTYQSAANPTYQVYYDITTSKWLVGENGVTAVLNSEETDNICPSDASSWSYVDGSQDCSISLICGSETIPDDSVTNSAGDGNDIPSENSLPTSVSATPEDCSCGNNLELSSSCLGATVQSNSIGEYEKVCVQDDDTQVYQHTTQNFYLYYESTLQKWLISSGIAGTSANIGISSSQSCAYEHSSLDTQWNFYDGANYVADCSMDLVCKSNRRRRRKRKARSKRTRFFAYPGESTDYEESEESSISDNKIHEQFQASRNGSNFESEQEEFFEEPNENNEAEKNNDKKQKRKRRTRFFAYPSSSVIKDIKDRNLAIAKAAKHNKKHRKHRINRTGGCSSGYTVTLDSTGSSYQPDTAGDYVEVCADDGKPIFRKSSNGYYLYAVENSGNVYWTISNRVGSTTFLVMGVFPTTAACPDGHSMHIVRTGSGSNDYVVSTGIAIAAT